MTNDPITVTFHLGARKTGTTAVQQLLFGHRDELLSEYGILVPDTFSRRNSGALHPYDRAHHELYHACRGSLNPAKKDKIKVRKRKFNALRKEIASSRCRHVIITSEILDDTPESGIKGILEEFPGCRFRVVFCFRRVDDYFESLVRQITKAGGSPRRKIAFGRHPFSGLTRWADQIGTENVTALSYNIPDRPSYNRRLVEALGLDAAKTEWFPTEANSSLSRLGWIVAKARLRASGVIETDSDKKVKRDFKTRDTFVKRSFLIEKSLPPDSNWSWFGYEDRLACFDHHLEQSQALAARFLQPADAAGFLDRSAIKPLPTLADLNITATEAENLLASVMGSFRRMRKAQDS